MPGDLKEGEGRPRPGDSAMQMEGLPVTVAEVRGQWTQTETNFCVPEHRGRNSVQDLG